MKSCFFVGLTLLLILAGCNPESTDSKKTKPATDHGHSHADGKDDHGHSHGDAPHGGTLFDWGGGAFHAEFTVDHDKQEATVYILGGDAKTPAQIKADKLQLTIDDPATELDLLPVPLDGEDEGMSSRFVGKHETFGIVKEFS
ncbi:MAG: hypothetical protein Q8M16_02650, partial [Pirellulaceae bacterium]|nr:hypothetical protein [Pirellulaceae bacterium]